MKSIGSLLVLTFLLVSCKNTTTSIKENISKKTQKNKITYTITIDKANQKRATVSMSFIPQNDILYMAPGANKLSKRWATFVQNLKATNSKGNPISVEELHNARWKLQSSYNEKITVSYEVILDHQDYEWGGGIDGVAYTTDWGVFYTGRSLLIFNGDQRKNIIVNFNLASDWHVTTPWDLVEGTKNSFVVNNQTALKESMFFAGTHENFSLKRGDFELVFSLGGDEVIAQKEDFKKLAGGVMDYYIELMGGIPNPSPDNKFKKSIVIINSNTVLTDGDVIGNNISMLIKKGGDKMSTMISRFMFAHEFFHLWNGKSIRPINDDTEWFKEGFTNYYTLKSLYHVGFLNDAAYFDILNNLFFQRYNADNGIGNISMTNGAEKHKHWGLIYGGGLFVAISQDMIIRKATNNEKNVDHLMKSLFQKYGGTNDGYSLEELRQLLSKLSGKNQSEFFKTYVNGTTRIPIESYLSMAGLNAEIKKGDLKVKKKKTANKLERNMIKGLFGIKSQN